MVRRRGLRLGVRLAVGLVAVAAAWAGAPRAHAQDEEAEPPAARAPAAQAPATLEPASQEPAVELPEVVVRPPQLHAGPIDTQPAETVTALRREEGLFDTPAAVTLLRGDRLRRELQVRSLPDALKGLPGVMVQKTGPLQSSPFIRGFTGYRNLALIDGIRLNNASFRDGPVQYWSTIDTYTIDRLELVRGPRSVLYGSDAIGGTINVIPNRRKCFARGVHVNGLLSVRGATGENSVMGRAQVEGNADRFGWLGGVSLKHYGDIISGGPFDGGRLPGTGGANEYDGDLRFDVLLSREFTLTAAYQHVSQRDAPRTHTTVDAVPFDGTTVGSELQRDHDQDRDLAYVRLAYEGCGLIDSGFLTLSMHRQYDQRDRLRTSNRQDLSGFDLTQTGVLLQLHSHTPIGDLTYGTDWYHDSANTWRRDFQDGVLTGVGIQGPFGDDSSYDLFGAYLLDEWSWGRFDFGVGARYTYASARAERVEDPVSGDIIPVDGSWSNVVGTAQALYHVNNCWNLYASVGQAFRAPTLYDLTSFDSTSVVETPAPDLDAENYIGFELGAKTEQRRFAASVAAWYMILEDTIIRSPTGDLVMGTPEVRKDNVGDGYAWGVELDAIWQVASCWQAYGNISWMEGKADELDPAGTDKVRSPLSRLPPLAGLIGVRLAPPRGRWWVEAEVAYAGRADRLSLRDRSDTQRIPPGGTPSWTTVTARAGARLGRHVFASLAVENLFDENYRLHGSGVNEPGVNFVMTLETIF